MQTTTNSLKLIAPPKSHSRWFYLTLVALAAFCLWQAVPRAARSSKLSLTQPALADTPRTSPVKTERVLETRRIQDIRTGMKVLGENPELAGIEIEEEAITPETHRNVVLVANKPDGSQVEMTLLRSLDWISEFGAEVGKTIDLTLTEIEAADQAEVVAIEPCPPLEDVPGHFVTGTFKHTATNVIDLYVEGLDKPIGTTANHPFWSENRQEFISAIDLRQGERLRQADGSIAKVLAQQRRDDQQAVYNLEVASQHVYHVGSAGLLVHNNCFGSPQFGQQVHDGFGDWLNRTHNRFPDIDRTAVGQTGVDLTFRKPVRGLRDRAGTVHPSFRHAELKPESWSGWDKFHDQLGNWRANGMAGDVGLFMYDASGNIFFVGTF